MIMMRTRLKNKLSLNKMRNSIVYVEGLKGIPPDQMALFLDVNQVVYRDPNIN